MRHLLPLVLAAACSSSGGRNQGARDLALSTGDMGPRFDFAVGDAPPGCEFPPTPAGPEVMLGPDFSSSYSVYALGAVPGVPSPLGGVVVKHDDPNTLLVAGRSEQANGAIYAIGVKRDGCGHIMEFSGTATKFADAPFVDANLVYGPQNLLVYTEWPQFTLSQMRAGTTTIAQTDLRALGINTTNDSGPGGVGFVPASLTAGGELRIVTWPAGRWYHLGATLNNGLYTINSVTQTRTLANNPGGFAYVPAGSPGFTAQSLIVAEWVEHDETKDRVAVYEVDAQGDPMVATRREFMSKFPRPWGAYFEPVTGDYLFLTWQGAAEDRVYLVQGFVPPPPVF